MKVRGKMSDVAADLLPYHFARSGESYLVNLAHLVSMQGNEIVVGTDRLPVSRGRRAEFRSAFTKYMGGF